MAFNFNNKSETAKKIFKVVVGKNDNEYVHEGVYYVVGENDYSVLKKLKIRAKLYNEKGKTREVLNIKSIEVHIENVIP